MVSRLRREWRRNCFGGNIRGCRGRTRGHFSVRETAPRYEVTHRWVVAQPIPSRLPRFRSGPLDDVRIPVVHHLCWAAWVVPPSVPLQMVGVHVRSTHGAEKSCRTRRRKRGLRVGKRRSRGRQPRRSAPIRQPLTKPQCARRVNHAGRKFIWAMRASNRFQNVCRKSLKKRTPCFRGWYKVKRGLASWWQQLDARARSSGIPYQVSFGKSWREYIDDGVFWDDVARDKAVDALGDIMMALPRRDPEQTSFRGLFDGIRPVERSSGVTDDVGNTVRTEPPSVCRKCDGLGATPGPGYPRGCRYCYRTPRARNRGESSRSSKGRGR